MRYNGFVAPILTIVLMSSSSWSKAAEIASTGMPYESIIARNVFGLSPLPPPDPDAGKPPVEPPPKIIPNGIMTIFGRDQALFKVAGKGKPGQQPKEQSYVLSEGERQDDIEVVKINHVDGIITFNNHGIIQELPLVAAKEGTPAGGPGNEPRGRQFVNGRLGGGMNPAFINERSGTMNARGMARSYNPDSNSGGVASSAAGNPQNNIEDRVMSAARNMAIIEENRIATQDLVNQGKMPPIPPTELTPGNATGPGGGPLIASPPTLPPVPGN